MRMQVQSLASLSGLRIWLCCGLWLQPQLDLAMVWLWCRPVATAPIQPLAWESPYVMGAALKRQRKKKERQENVPLFYKLPSGQTHWKAREREILRIGGLCSGEYLILEDTSERWEARKYCLWAWSSHNLSFIKVWSKVILKNIIFLNNIIH